MFTDTRSCLRTFTECICMCVCVCVCLYVCVREAVFSSHLDSLNGSVDINLFSWMAIAIRMEITLYHPGDQRRINATCPTKMMCV